MENAKRVALDRNHRGLCGGFGLADGDRRWPTKRENAPRGGIIIQQMQKRRLKFAARPTAPHRKGRRAARRSKLAAIFPLPRTVIRSLAGQATLRSDWAWATKGLRWETGTRLSGKCDAASWVWPVPQGNCKLVQRLCRDGALDPVQSSQDRPEQLRAVSPNPSKASPRAQIGLGAWAAPPG